MDNITHAAGPLFTSARLDGSFAIEAPHDPRLTGIRAIAPFDVAAGLSEANARRLVAAWNAFEGIPTAKLEGIPRGYFAAVAIRLETLGPVAAADLQQRAETAERILIEAERFIAGFEGDDLQDEPVDDLLGRIRKVTTGAATPAATHSAPDAGEVIVRLADGWTLRSGSETRQSGDYVRLCAPDGAEATYWHNDEWRDDPVLVMGAIMNTAAGIGRDASDPSPATQSAPRALATHSEVLALADEATQAALNAGCALVQDAMGVATGDTAAMFWAGGEEDSLRDAFVSYIRAEQSAARVEPPQGVLIPAAPDLGTIDPDTGAPIVRPAHVIHGGNAYWVEFTGGKIPYLMNAAIAADGSICWDEESEVEEKQLAYFPEFDSIMAKLGVPLSLFVDGTTHEGGDTYDSEGQFPPFVVFNLHRQQTIAGPFPTRADADAERLVILAAGRPVFEVTAAGFDAETDETDDRVLWVLAESAEQVQAAIKDTGAAFCGELPAGHGVAEGAIDFDLTKPGDAMRFGTALLEWASHERNKNRAA